jgi:DnaJ family protein C protein 13
LSLRAEDYPFQVIAGMETPQQQQQQLLLPAAGSSPRSSAASVGSTAFHEHSQAQSSHGGHHPNPLEEPEYICRYSVTKHSWRGKYKRVFCISPTQILTLDPATLATTNEYDIATDFEGAAPVAGGREDPLQQHALEFTINVRNEGRGKFKPMRFSSRY